MTTAPPISAEITVDSQPLFSVERTIFGQFIEHFHREIYGGIYAPDSPLSDSRGFRLDVLDALRELKVPVVRWPGGSFASGYHWKDATGPEREPVYDRAWRVAEPNTFGTDEFLAWTAELGAAAYICTNAGTGTITEVTDWVEYCNLPVGTRWSNRRAANGRSAPYGVAYWSVGNENYERWELGADDPASWARKVTELAKAMRRVDPTIKLLAATNGSRQWTLPMLEMAGHDLDYISIHRYWDELADINEPSDYARAIARAHEPDRTIQQLVALLETAQTPHIGIAFDEWNLRGWHHPEGNDRYAIDARDRNDDNSTYTMADAIFTASFLNACMRHGDRVKMANFAPAVNARGPLYVHRNGLVKRSTFHVFKMLATRMAQFALSTTTHSAAMETDGVEFPAIDAMATGELDSGKVTISLVNKSASESRVVRIRVDNRALSGPQQLTILTADSPDAYNDVDSPHRVVPEHTTYDAVDGLIVLPPHSVSLLETDAPNGGRHGSRWASTTSRGWYQING